MDDESELVIPLCDAQVYDEMIDLDAVASSFKPGYKVKSCTIDQLVSVVGWEAVYVVDALEDDIRREFAVWCLRRLGGAALSEADLVEGYLWSSSMETDEYRRESPEYKRLRKLRRGVVKRMAGAEGKELYLLSAVEAASMFPFDSMLMELVRIKVWNGEVEVGSDYLTAREWPIYKYWLTARNYAANTAWWCVMVADDREAEEVAQLAKFREMAAEAFRRLNWSTTEMLDHGRKVRVSYRLWQESERVRVQNVSDASTAKREAACAERQQVVAARIAAKKAKWASERQGVLDGLDWTTIKGGVEL